MDWTRRYVEIPAFVDRGRDFLGVDCWGLVWLVWRHEVGRDLPSYHHDYQSSEEQDWLGELIDDQVARYWQRVEDWRPFDVLVFGLRQRDGGVRNCHVGVMVDPVARTFLHAQKRDVVRLASFGEGNRARAWRDRLAAVVRPADA